MNSRWLVEIAGPGNSGQVFYALPHAGAGAAAVKQVCRALGEIYQTVAVRLPGRESRMDEDAITDLEVVCDGLAAQILAYADGRQIILCGHCAGAVFAYETGCRLPPHQLACLVVSAHQAPDRMPTRSSWRLPQDEFLARVISDGYLPAEIVAEPELMELVLPALRADYQAIECHTSALRLLRAPILALLGNQEHSMTVQDVAAWSRLTSAEFRLELLPGGHNLFRDQSAEVAKVIRSAMPGLRTGFVRDDRTA